MPGRTADGGKLRCPRCSGNLDTSAFQPAAAAYDAWEMDEQLRHIQRVLVSNRLGGDPPAAIEHQPARTDVPHAGPPAWHIQPAQRPIAQAAPAGHVRRGWMLGLLIWTALVLGTMAFVCGGALLAASLIAGRQEFWTLGLPIALGGQIVVLVGLILQLDRLWHDSRTAAGKLDQVDRQLSELKTTTTLLGASHGPSAAAFYAHLADGASPQILLRDLKSQLDLLALKLGRE